MTTPEFRLGVSSVEATAIAQIDGDKTRGSLPWPRMTTAQRAAITGTNGLAVYDTDFQALFVWESGAWARSSSSGGGVANGFTTTATAAGTTTLTNASTPVQEFTGATTQDCVLPDATTLIVGWTFVIRNTSTGAVTVKTNGGATLVTLAANQKVTLYCKTIGTAAGTWSQEVVTGAGARVLAQSPTIITSLIVSGAGFDIKPASDSTTALEFTNAAGTAVMTLDTTNMTAIFGNAVSTTNSSKLAVGFVPTDTSGSRGGIVSQMSANPASVSSANYVAGWFEIGDAALSEAITGSLQSLRLTSQIRSAVTIANTYGLYAVLPAFTAAIAATITNAYGVRVGAPVYNSGAITNLYGLYLDSVSGAGTLNAAILTNAGLIIFNEGGDASSDLRIEGDTDANLFFTDASADVVGIGTATPGTKVHVRSNTSATNAVVNVLTLEQDSTGTPAAGLGSGLHFAAESSTTEGVSIARLRALYTTVTHASYATRAVLSGFDSTGERDVIGIGANGSAALLGFYPTKAAAPVAQPTALTTQLTAITHTAPGTPDYAVQDLTQTTPFGFVTKDEGNTVLSVIANLQTRVGELETKLTALGLIA